ncbi:MAG: isoprenylcysteine carboxylmethyltransferase family protein, partial [Anaerolineales bacterium]
MDYTKKTVWKSWLFVIVQIISLGLIGVTGPLFAAKKILLFIETIGLFLGIWAVLIMKPGYFNITPDPLSRSKLVKAGPYRYIRHPMYLAL